MAFIRFDWDRDFDDASPIGISTSMKEDIGNNYYCTENNTMSNEKFTQGPWEVVGHQIEAVGKFQDGRCTGYGCNNNFVCDLDDGEYHEYGDEEECAANAALIAAAPEMYSKLKTVLVLCEGNLLRKTRCDILGQEIRELLREARGEK